MEGNMSEWDYIELQELIHEHRWADGFTKVKQSKITKILGNGCSWGMMHFVFMIIPYVTIGMIIDSEAGVLIAMILVCLVSVILSIYTWQCTDKLKYNKLIDKNLQMNLFKDFNIKQDVITIRIFITTNDEYSLSNTIKKY